MRKHVQWQKEQATFSSLKYRYCDANARIGQRLREFLSHSVTTHL